VLRSLIERKGLVTIGEALFRAKSSKLAAPLLLVVGNACAEPGHHQPTEAVAAVPSIMRSVLGIIIGKHPAAVAAAQRAVGVPGRGSAGLSAGALHAGGGSSRHETPSGPGGVTGSMKARVGAAAPPVDLLALEKQAMWVIANLVSPPGRGEKHARFFVEGGALEALNAHADGSFAVAIEAMLALV